jgi:hypothetical protein
MSEVTMWSKSNCCLPTEVSSSVLNLDFQRRIHLFVTPFYTFCIYILNISIKGLSMFVLTFLSFAFVTEDTINVARITRASVNSFANVVTLEALPAVRNASSIQIEPLTIEGWELLEVFAQQLEEGALLKQVSIVSPRQEFSLKLGNDLVGIRVLEDGFCHDGKAETCKDSCLRLVDDTEVVVTPRPRASNGADKDVVYEESGPIRVLPNHADFSPAMKQLYKLFESGSCLDDLLPCPPMFTALMHPDSLSSVQGWDSTCANDPNSTLDSFSPSSAHVEIQKCPRNMVMDSRQSHTAVVEITSSKMIPLGCIGEFNTPDKTKPCLDDEYFPC